MLSHSEGCMLSSITQCVTEPFTELLFIFINLRLETFLIHYRNSLHIHWKIMPRVMGKNTPVSGIHVLPGGMVKLRGVLWLRKVCACTSICRRANRCIYLPSKTNGKSYQLSYVSAPVPVHFVHSWEHITITRDDVSRDSGNE